MASEQDSAPANWVLVALAAAGSGALLAACFPPLSIHWLVWAAMVPWLLVLPRTGPGPAWLFGILLGLVFYRIGVAWGLTVAGPVGGVIMVVLSVWMGFAFRVARLIMERFPTAGMLIGLPLVFVGQEVLRSEALPRLRIPFLALGYSQSSNLWIAQIASLGGVYFLTWLILTGNACLAYGIMHRTWRSWLPAVGFVLLVVTLGFLSQPPDFSNQPPIAVACVQAESERYRAYEALTRTAVDPAETPAPALVVLPEHTITDYADEDHPLVRSLARMARTARTYICVGAHTRAAPTAACDYDNVGLLIGPEGRILAQQGKSVPLPFFVDGNPAREQHIVATPHGGVGMLICYDALFTDISRRLVDRGAQILLVPVMDAKRWPDQERLQHAAMAPFRSIELRRCAVRAASSGVSQIIDATGRVTAERSRQQGPGVLGGMAYAVNVDTIFARLGYLFAPLTGLLFLGAVAALTVGEWVTRIRKHLR